jgi:hypothetical protein
MASLDRPGARASILIAGKVSSSARSTDAWSGFGQACT